MRAPMALFVLMLMACGSNDVELTYEDDATCWYVDGDPTLHRYYPPGYVQDEELELACERLGKPIIEEK